jgi:hypothetical protein
MKASWKQQMQQRAETRDDGTVVVDPKYIEKVEQTSQKPWINYWFRCQLLTGEVVAVRIVARSLHKAREEKNRRIAYHFPSSERSFPTTEVEVG